MEGKDKWKGSWVRRDFFTRMKKMKRGWWKKRRGRGRTKRREKKLRRKGEDEAQDDEEGRRGDCSQHSLSWSRARPRWTQANSSYIGYTRYTHYL